MKRFFYTLSFVSLVLLASCQKTALPIEEFEGPAELQAARQIAFDALQKKLARLGMLEAKATGLTAGDLDEVYLPGTKAGEDLPAAFTVNFRSGGFSLITIREEIPDTKISVKKAVVKPTVVAVTTSGTISTTGSGANDAAGSNATVNIDVNKEADTPAATTAKQDLEDLEEDSSFDNGDEYENLPVIDTGYLGDLLRDAIENSLPDEYKKTKDYGPWLGFALDQDDHLNLYSPNGHAGCVVTALMQIIGYYGYPAVSKIYSTKKGTLGKDCTWDDLKKINSYKAWWGKDMNDEKRAAIDECASNIAWRLGQPDLTDSDYRSSNGTSSNSRKARKTLKVLGYEGLRRHISFNDLSNRQLKEIDEMIINQRPVYMEGSNSSRTEGHAWVVDGLSDDMYHINWGWGGYNNGWFHKGLFDLGKCLERDENSTSNKTVYCKDFRYILYKTPKKK